MSKDQLYIFDTTLRDGAQTQGVDFSIDDKEKIAFSLDELGVDYIEGGWPGANPTDTEFFNKDHNFKSANLTAFGMTKKLEHSAENDPMLSSLINSKSTSVCLFGKSWDFQVKVALGISNEENLTNISEIGTFPPLVFAGETRHLKQQLADVVDGTRHTAGVFEFINADNPVSFSALRPDLFVIPKHVSLEFLKLCFF